MCDKCRGRDARLRIILALAASALHLVTDASLRNPAVFEGESGELHDAARRIGTLIPHLSIPEGVETDAGIDTFVERAFDTIEHTLSGLTPEQVRNIGRVTHGITAVLEAINGAARENLTRRAAAGDESAQAIVGAASRSNLPDELRDLLGSIGSKGGMVALVMDGRSGDATEYRH